MDGFDAFDSPAAAEIDPAAEFLAQEQEDLAELGEDMGFNSPPQDIEVVQNMDFFSSNEPNTEVKQEDDAIQVSFLNPTLEENNGFFMSENPNPFLGSDNDMFQEVGENGMETLTNGMGNINVREEPESIKKWKIEQEEKLKLKDENEEKKRKELKEQAKQELNDWYKHYEEQLQKTKENNRSAEETFVSEINDIQPGTEWERVAKQCDFSAKNTRNTKDVSRMRGILLQLKQNPPTRE
ncbi:clathrin light chain isoform X2 [Eurytemora carolleeae]|uniref:clathrin light chain isoform X2 n=1 Tax=Eurytemora carolleeae TaxID=1294199 RepID=UPI000C756D11|nr:clathrin light chain isoform X2 [Eurytemora carolleeae]|eukprot:XP_023339160.1 clathrin light chain-like isoform X2 [Eurytemora affinis]